MINFLSPKQENRFGGWSRTVEVGGVAYRCVVEQGKPVRIPYKPRGQNRGFRYLGSVYRVEDGRRLWIDDVAGSIGCKGLLSAAGLL